jgi:hypothetical protein
VAGHLHRLGLEVKTKVAHTGVVGILRGQKDTPVVALDEPVLAVKHLTMKFGGLTAVENLSFDLHPD